MKIQELTDSDKIVSDLFRERNASKHIQALKYIQAERFN